MFKGRHVHSGALSFIYRVISVLYKLCVKSSDISLTNISIWQLAREWASQDHWWEYQHYNKWWDCKPIRGSVSLHTNNTHTQQPHSHKLAEVSFSNSESGGKVCVFKVEVKECTCEVFIISQWHTLLQNWWLKTQLLTLLVMMTADQVWLTWAPLTKKDTEPSKQLKLDVSAPASQKLVTQSELIAMIGRYVVENMLPLSTGDSDSFRALTGKIPGRAGAGPPCRKHFSKYIDAEWAKKKFWAQKREEKESK